MSLQNRDKILLYINIKYNKRTEIAQAILYKLI